MLFYDSHVHRLLTDERRAGLRRAMEPRRNRVGTWGATAELALRLAARRRSDCYDRPATAGLPR
jgi:hypothetical protein